MLDIAYIFTSFPVHTETFLQREVRAMREQGVSLRLYSLFGGQSDWEGLPVRRLHLHRVPEVLAFHMPRWGLYSPSALREPFAYGWHEPLPSALNIGENIWGFGAALLLAEEFRRNPPSLIHAVWSSMPAACAWYLSELCNRPFTIGAHAYDVFEHGGDWLLRQKLARASLIHTSTESARRQLLALGAPSDRLALIRRGLSALPDFKPLRKDRSQLRLLSVGRLVEKKGYPELLHILYALHRSSIPFEARIVGSGPLRSELEKMSGRLGLASAVSFMGALSESATAEQFKWADFFLFTGKVSANGDRDGLPNVIPEAMAHGVPVLASAVGGVPEAVSHENNGLLLDPRDPRLWATTLKALAANASLCERLRTGARKWVETNFNADRNASVLKERWLQIVASSHQTRNNQA